MPRRIAKYMLEGRVNAAGAGESSVESAFGASLARSRLLSRLESESLEVCSTSERLWVELPPFEKRWFPAMDLTGMSNALRERVELRIVECAESGHVQALEYRFVYWSLLQTALHAAICAFVLLMPSFGGAHEFAFFALGHLVAFGAWWVTVRAPAEMSLRRALLGSPVSA